MEKDLGRGVLRDESALVVKLHILEAELEHLLVRVSLRVLAGSQAEEEGDLDEFSQALYEGAGGFSCLRSGHDKAHQGGFL